MAEKTTWIKLDRNLTRWNWYGDGNTVRVFIHLLLKANVKDGLFLGYKIKRGELATSQSSLSGELYMSISNVRTALDHLQESEEITIKRTPKFSIISITNYNKYQCSSQSIDSLDDSQSTVKPQQYKNRRKKTIKKENKENQVPETVEDKSEEKYIPEVWEVDKPKEYWGRFKTETEYYAYMQSGGE